MNGKPNGRVEFFNRFLAITSRFIFIDFGGEKVRVGRYLVTRSRHYWH